MTTFGNMGPLSKAVYLVNLGAVLMVCGTNMVAPYPPAKSVEMEIELDKSPLTILVEEQTHFLSREHEDHTIAERQEVAENDHAGTTLEDARRLAEIVKENNETHEGYLHVVEELTEPHEMPRPVDVPEELLAKQESEREAHEESSDRQRDNLEARTATWDERQQGALMANLELAIDAERARMDERHAAERAAAVAELAKESQAVRTPPPVPPPLER